MCPRPWASSPPITRPCVRARGLPHRRQTCDRWTDLSFPSCACAVSVEAFFSIPTTARTSLVYTVIPLWKLEASNRDASAEQKWVRVITIEVFFLRRKCWLWVLCTNVRWETSKEHHSQFGIFKECSSPQKGNPLESVSAFIKTLYRSGKLIEVRKRRGKDQKAKTPAKQKPGGKKKKNVLYPYRLPNDIRHLWKLASELLMRMFFCLSLVSLRLPCLVSEISGVISIHTKLWVFIEISTRKKKKPVKWWKVKWANTSASHPLEFDPPCPYLCHPWKETHQMLIFLLLFSTVTALCWFGNSFLS